MLFFYYYEVYTTIFVDIFFFICIVVGIVVLHCCWDTIFFILSSRTFHFPSFHFIHWLHSPLFPSDFEYMSGNNHLLSICLISITCWMLISLVWRIHRCLILSFCLLLFFKLFTFWKYFISCKKNNNIIVRFFFYWGQFLTLF